MRPVHNEAEATADQPDAKPGAPGKASTESPQTSKITVALIMQAASDLDHIRQETGFSKTDVVNKAITLYRFISDELRNNGELFLKRPDGETHLIRLL